MAGESDAEEIRQLARTYQYDRYLAALLQVREHRDALIVLAAFGGEMQRIPFIVSEPMMAAVRLQWWRDELSGVAQSTGQATGEMSAPRRTGHALFDALGGVVGRYNLPIGLLQGMVDAAETELDATPLQETAELRQVLTKFDGALFELAARVLGSGDAAGEEKRQLWGQAAIAFGGARLASEAVWRSKVGAQAYVPRDMGTDNAEEGAAALRAEAEVAFEAVSVQFAGLDRAAKGALLPLASIPPLLRAVAKSETATEGQPVEISALRRVVAVLGAHWRSRIG